MEMQAIVIDKQDDVSLSRIATSEVNPLKHVFPPSHDHIDEDQVLLEAKTIKDILEDVGRRDPTAREHIFNFRIADANVELLRRNGFTVTHEEHPEAGTLTSVRWKDAAHVLTVIPIPRDD